MRNIQTTKTQGVAETSEGSAVTYCQLGCHFGSPGHFHNNATKKHEYGFTLIEIAISLAVIAVALLALMSTVTTSSSLQHEAHELTQAMNAARSVVEQMKTSGTFAEIFRRYNSTALDDTGLQGIIPGNLFDVTGFRPSPTDPDQRVGLVVFPSDPTNPSVLLENSAIAKKWLPNGIDLNLDGVIDGMDHSGDYQLLPVIIVIEWYGIGGRHQVELPTIIYPQSMKQ
jgi:prepilin-type N-terminal cleavage/methylation domain-containing protein